MIDVTPLVLIVDDEKNTREGLAQALELEYEVYTASNADEAFRLMEVEVFDVILTDLKMAGKSGMSVIDKAVKLDNNPICIMMTAYGSIDIAVDAMKRGAFDFLLKPVSLEKLEILIKRALQSRKLKEENKTLHARLDQKFNFDAIIGNSSAMVEVMNKVKQVASAKATVLLTGETGTGKELIAQMIHQNSPRARLPFVPVHCAALPANLLESELFGHEKGAFTGATQTRVGRFEAADGGTLFLDEIGEIEPEIQIKLLRFLETKSFERIGSTDSLKVDVRLICATNRNLEAMVKKGTFREDLYYRLNVINIELPPLRSRQDDIPLLLDHYMQIFCEENDTPDLKFSPKVITTLKNYKWPGNIRELRNFCENMVVMKRGGEVSDYDLDPKFFGDEKDSSADVKEPEKRLSATENEKRLIRNALLQSKGNRTEAAKLMGISRRTLHRKLIQWPELDIG